MQHHMTGTGASLTAAPSGRRGFAVPTQRMGAGAAPIRGPRESCAAGFVGGA
jgi:hypothetical protein